MRKTETFYRKGEIIMNTKLLVTLAFVAPLFLTNSTLAGNPQHVQRLLETRECVNCDLSGVNLSEEHLIGADLRNANLEGANLKYANLEGADLTGANLTRANLSYSMLSNVNFKNANLNNTDLSRAKIYDANVFGASMNDMNITDAEIFNTGIGIGGKDLQLEDWD